MRVDEDTYINGNLSAKSMTVPAGSVADAQIAAAANTVTTKMQHKHRKNYSQSGTVVAATVPMHVVTATTPLVSGAAATAAVLSFRAGSITPCTGDATITVDLQKNGSSLLTAPITLNSSSTARVSYAGTIGDGDLEPDDWLDVVVTVNAGTGALGTGLLVHIELDENAQ